MYQVVKRDGKVVDFAISKISAAITKAFDAINKQYHPSVIELLALHVTSDFESKIKDDKITVEEIQDSVEKVLSESGYADVAKAYILYRKQREKVRNINSTLLNYKDIVDNYLKINDWRVKENSTVTYSVELALRFCSARTHRDPRSVFEVILQDIGFRESLEFCLFVSANDCLRLVVFGLDDFRAADDFRAVCA